MAVAAAPYGRCGGAALRGVPLALQNKRNECGLACLAMVVGFYDRTVSLADLRRRFPGFEQGATLKDLVECARALVDGRLQAAGCRRKPSGSLQRRVGKRAPNFLGATI